MITKRECAQELVKARDDDSHDCTKDPDPYGITRHIGVISVGDCRPYFWVG